LVVEARLDLRFWASGPHLAELWVDMTNHHVWASRCRSGAIVGGRVAAEAEKAKHDRYGEGQGGFSATPDAVESWGRFGLVFERLLSQLEARRVSLRNADAGTCASLDRRWRAEIGTATALVRAQHVTFHRCAVDSGGAGTERTALGGA
jgi:hypothetical protein